jgi:hypothetical protein
LYADIWALRSLPVAVVATLLNVWQYAFIDPLAQDLEALTLAQGWRTSAGPLELEWELLGFDQPLGRFLASPCWAFEDLCLSVARAMQLSEWPQGWQLACGAQLLTSQEWIDSVFVFRPLPAPRPLAPGPPSPP